MEQAVEIEKEQLHNSAAGETDFWRARSAQFNMLHQQLSKPAVRRILNVSENWRIISKLNSNLNFLTPLSPFQIMQAKESHDNNVLEEFNIAFKEFSKEHAKAKDFLKFLQTLERQFRFLGQGTLSVIEETIPSLLNGLKLIWTISRHIN